MSTHPPLFVTEYDGVKDVGVTQPVDARLALSGLFTDPSVPGIVYGSDTNGQVSGSTSGPNMNYRVAAGTFATLRSAGQGLLLWSNDGTVNLTGVAPAPGSGTRYDLVWARAKDGSQAGPDADSDTEFGVAVGTAAPSNPAKPTGLVPAGALILCEVLVGTGIANASLATYAMVAPLKVTGGPTPVRSAAERNALTSYVGRQVIRLDVGHDKNNAASKGRVETWDGTGWFTFRFGEEVVTTNGSGDFATADTGLTAVKTGVLENSNGGAATGNRQNITVAKNAAYGGTTLTGRVYSAESHAAVASTAVGIAWKAWGYA